MLDMFKALSKPLSRQLRTMLTRFQSMIGSLIHTNKGKARRSINTGRFKFEIRLSIGKALRLVQIQIYPTGPRYKLERRRETKSTKETLDDGHLN